MKRKTIRGCGGDAIRVEDVRGDTGYFWAMASEDDPTEEYERNEVAVRLTLVGARRLHAALGELLASKPKRRRRS